jgi:hypothetical protein
LIKEDSLEVAKIQLIANKVNSKITSKPLDSLSITEKFEMMYGGKGTALGDKGKAMGTYIQNMHNARYFMPPFPGNEKEMKALVKYIQHLQGAPGDVHPAQTDGVGPEMSSIILPRSN